MLHDRLDGSRDVGLREQLVADAAGIAAFLQMCEHLRVVDLARARLMAARCVSHMDMTEGVAVVRNRVADAALVDLHMIYIIQQLEARAADQANDLGAHLGGREEVADMVGGDVQSLEIEVDLLLLCKLCTGEQGVIHRAQLDRVGQVIVVVDNDAAVAQCVGMDGDAGGADLFRCCDGLLEVVQILLLVGRVDERVVCIAVEAGNRDACLLGSLTGRIRDLDATREAAEKAGIAISGFNGDADYSLVDPTHKQKYLDYLKESIAAAKKVGAASVTIHSNALGDGGIVVNHYDNLSHTVKLCSMYDTLLACAELAEKEEINLNLEALNITTDHVGNFLATTQMGAEIVRLIGSPRLKLLYDVYHMQINEGCICDTISNYGDTFGHIHVADAPGRHEPGTGEINYPFLKRLLVDELKFDGIFAFELSPLTTLDACVEAMHAF